MKKLKKPSINEFQYNKLKKRIKKMSGFNMTLMSMRQQFDNFNINQRLLNNEIKSLHKRIDMLEKKMMNAFRNKKWVVYDNGKERRNTKKQ